MLACVRHTTQRTAAFSTTARAGHNVNEAVTNILQDQAKKEAKTIAPKITTTNFPAYRVLYAGQPLLPNTLTYKHAFLKPKIFKRPAVAPGPSVTRNSDTFHQLKLDPRHFTSNGGVLQHFVTEMGKIKSRDQTGLTAKSQRLVGRTIRRAKMMGVIPILSKGYRRFH